MHRAKELDAATTRINLIVNEGLKMIRDKKMQEITAERKRRNTLQSIMTCKIFIKTLFCDDIRLLEKILCSCKEKLFVFFLYRTARHSENRYKL